MKELRWSMKSWHVLLYKSAYGIEYKQDMPNNICAYWWKLLAAIVTMPVAVIGHSINIIRRKTSIVAIWWSLYPIICIGLGAMMEVGEKNNIPWNKNHHSWWYILGEGFLMSIAIIVGLMILALLCYLVDKIAKWIKKRKLNNPKKSVYPKEEKSNPIWEGLKAWKGKYCSKITWY